MQFDQSLRRSAFSNQSLRLCKPETQMMLTNLHDAFRGRQVKVTKHVLPFYVRCI